MYIFISPFISSVWGISVTTCIQKRFYEKSASCLFLEGPHGRDQRNWTSPRSHFPCVAEKYSTWSLLL